MGVYGSMLEYFPELLGRYLLYPVYKSPNGGITVKTDETPIKVTGIAMDTKSTTSTGGKSSPMSWIFQQNNLDLFGKKQFWSKSNLDDYLPIDTDYDKPCSYALLDTRMKDSVPIYYELAEKISWNFEGDFYKYEVRLIGGNHAINEQSTTADDYANLLS